MRLIKNTTEGGRGTFIGAKLDKDNKPLERERVFFPGGVVTEIDDAKLKEALQDPIVKSWFDDGILVEQTPAAKVEAKAATETKPAPEPEKKADKK